MGWQMAEWVVNGEPSLDLWHMDIRRFGRQYRSQAYTLARSYETAAETFATYPRVTSEPPLRCYVTASCR